MCSFSNNTFLQQCALLDGAQMSLTVTKLFCYIEQLKCTFCVSRVFTWLIAVSCGQGRHDSCPLFPGVPQAVEIVRGCQSADLLCTSYWRTSSIYWQVLCHWTLQENQVLAVMKTRLHTSLSLFVCSLLYKNNGAHDKHTDLGDFLLHWIYTQSTEQHVISTTDASVS